MWYGWWSYPIKLPAHWYNAKVRLLCVPYCIDVLPWSILWLVWFIVWIPFCGNKTNIRALSRKSGYCQVIPGAQPTPLSHRLHLPLPIHHHLSDVKKEGAKQIAGQGMKVWLFLVVVRGVKRQGLTETPSVEWRVAGVVFTLQPRFDTFTTNSCRNPIKSKTRVHLGFVPRKMN
jgi:hypothetical protein